ncbi:MAG: RNA polymerase factor sigma-32 [Alphaproteobacteria bacterium]|nr:RNA polymerase factor sigma-32 [Alphaproteobacteria bacterium]MCL2757862.1 RNA polymerase factor sigma-32 [Alphaproteobacteria bacterium]
MKGNKDKKKDNQKTATALPAAYGMPSVALSDDANLERYIRSVQAFPLLSAEEEHEFAVAWRDARDKFAAEKLVSSHLRMVVSVAYDFKNYGIPISELIASGNLGLMQALSKFDPDRGFRFSTYAMFWIKAEIYDFVLNNWSMVKIGTSANQKRVFFNLARAKRALGIMDNNLSDEQTKQIAEYLEVPEQDVTRMSRRISARDLSLNRPAYSDESEGTDILSNLADDSESIEDRIEHLQFRKFGHELLHKHLASLPERDREILVARRLSDPALTLEQLSEKLGISRERVRQIEERAFTKLQSLILADANKA